MKKKINKKQAEKIASILKYKIVSDCNSWLVELRPFRIRTTGYKSQNHHFYGHVQQIAVETGESVSNVAFYIKERAVALGFPYKLSAWGRLVPKSESEATTTEAAFLIEAAHVVAAELGIVLEEGDEEDIF